MAHPEAQRHVHTRRRAATATHELRPRAGGRKAQQQQEAQQPADSRCLCLLPGSPAHAQGDPALGGSAPASPAPSANYSQRGVPADRLIAKGYGTSRPLVPNDTEAGRDKNRRVEFEIKGTM